MRRLWSPETRLLEHREQERLNREADEARQAAQSQLLNGPVSKLQIRRDFPQLPQVCPVPCQSHLIAWTNCLLQPCFQHSAAALKSM